MSARSLARHSQVILQYQKNTYHEEFLSSSAIWLHWLDNFSRNFPSSGMYFNKKLFCNLNWTAHGAKLFPLRYDESWVVDNGALHSACPPLTGILHKDNLARLVLHLSKIDIKQFDSSFVYRRHVNRVPLKAHPLTKDEEKHYSRSFDGLSTFVPVDIYEDNIQSRAGMLACLNHVLRLCGAGDAEHPRVGLYSFLLLDVSTFWMLIRILYSFVCFEPVRKSLYVFFGLWHPYSYANVAIWNCFRHTFIGPAFFHLFPSDMLLKRPSLTKCSTFFTFMRQCYPTFRAFLLENIDRLRSLTLQFDIDNVSLCIENKPINNNNPYRHRLVHLYNLHCLFDFCLPVVQDYISLLKHNDWWRFRRSSLKLLLLFIMIQNKGAQNYRAPMLFFMLKTMYWADHDQPIMSLLRANHTMFSEESGEIALSRLASLQPTNMRESLRDTKEKWQSITHVAPCGPKPLPARPRKSKFRLIGNYLLLLIRNPSVFIVACGYTNKY